ncbi:unnamed protein product [Pichia kudriavzevii]
MTMNILVRQGTKRTLALQSATHVLLFRYINETQKCAIELIDRESFSSKSYKQLSRSKPQGFLGLIEMNNDIFLCVITSKLHVAQPLPHESIYKIVDVEFHSLTNDTWDFLDMNSNGYPNIENEPNGASSSIHNDYTPRIPQHPCWELRKLLSDGSFFYSTDFDLTSTLQGRGVHDRQRLSMDLFHTDYMWNDFMMEGIINYRNNLSEKQKLILDDDHFLTTVIRGFAETLNAQVDGKPCTITIISKQSWKRAGTRFNVRGVDDDGNVANFVETELIFTNHHYIFAFTQIRGSIPVFWEQDTALIAPKVQITRSFEAAQPTFAKHFEMLNSKYGPIHIVNLLSKTRSSEIELSETYKAHFKKLQSTTPDSVFFTDFDFHHETAKTYADATRLLPFLHDSFRAFDYFLYDNKRHIVVNEQKGTFRTNCLDCLDRTNVIQQVISLNALMEFLHSVHYHDFSNLKNRHSTLWADHGDRISQIYTGTNALKSSFSRSGKMGFAGALSDATKSISRIYINNFVDKGKQQVTDTLLGKISNQNQVVIYDPVNDFINSELQKFESKFTTHENITIFTGTFNLAGAHNNQNLTDWLFPYDNFNPDVFVIGFQEVIELNASNILKSDGSVGQYWTKEVEKTIQKNANDNYILLRSEFMSSILLLLFVKEDKVPLVTEVEGKSKKTGLGGMTANKGTVAIRLNIASTSFCFVNSHFAAGLSYTEERNNDFISSWNGVRFSRNRYIKHHDNIVWLGDLNYRITFPNEKARALIKENDLSTLFTRDQLSYQMMRIKEFKCFQESEIKFPPTYKFDKFSDDYDTSEKQRVPAWTDRIIYRGKYLESVAYDSVPIVKFTDHRPVFSVFNSRITIIDEETKDSISNKLRESFLNNSNGKSEYIDLNDVASSAASSVMSTNSSRATTINLIDMDTSTPSTTPPLPRRPVPPVYNAQETKKMLVPGLTPVNIQNAIHVPNIVKQTPRASPASSEPTNFGSISVMTPTISRSGSTPPPPPPRRKPAESASQPSSPMHGASSLQEKVAEPLKTAPIVPSKPKALNGIYTGDLNKSSSSQAQASTTSWVPMTPTKKL